MKNITLSVIKKSGLIIGLISGLSSLNIAYAHGNADIGINLVGNIAPGVYGRININNQAPPPVIYSQPVIVERPYYSRAPEPVYMYVPDRHYKHWENNCYRYNACGQNVYFINPNYLERRDREDRSNRRDDRRDIREINYTTRIEEYNDRPRHYWHRRHHREEHRDGRWGDRDDY